MSVRILIPSGALGLGYDATALERGIANKPDLIAIDGGSTDSGPSYLGRGVSKYARSSTKIEWAGLMDAARRAGCPLVIGTAGTCGAGSAVDWLLDITREVLAETGHSAKIAVLRSDQGPDVVAEAFETGRVTPLPAAPEIDVDLIQSCTNIVALAGVEQISTALATGDPDYVRHKLRDGWHACGKMWGWWLAGSATSYMLVPPPWQPPFTAGMSLLWLTYVSARIHRPTVGATRKSEDLERVRNFLRDQRAEEE